MEISYRTQLLKPGERIDDMGFGNIQLIQKPDEFCYGIDAVLLADMAAKVRNKPVRIADLGAGNGAVTFILASKYTEASFFAVEIQNGSADRMSRTVTLNGLENQIEVFRGNIKDITSDHNGIFDIVVTNPPYVKPGAGIINESSAKLTARQETDATLEDFFISANRLLRDRGHLFMVHRPLRLADIMTGGRDAGLEPKDMRLVAPVFGAVPNIVLVHFVKGGGKELHVAPELYVRNADGTYTEELQMIYGKKC